MRPRGADPGADPQRQRAADIAAQHACPAKHRAKPYGA
jgi:hypothetical protein